MLRAMSRRVSYILVIAMAALAADVGEVRAHDFRPGVLALEEREPGTFQVAFSAPVDTQRAERTRVAPRFPSQCRRRGALLICGERGLVGQVAVEGLEGRDRVVLSVRRLDGSRREAVLSADAPQLELSADQSMFSTLGVWSLIGAEHVLLGLDHVLFLFGLLLVVGFDRRLVLTVTAFTLAHSITLALAALDVVHVPTAPVEACIALSVLLVAREAMHEENTATRRAPWLVAFGFGLVHGLGFAGALSEVGLPESSVVGALVGFNVGVELGQLGLILVAFAIFRLARAPLTRTRKPRLVACYAIGSVAAFWLVARTIAIVG